MSHPSFETRRRRPPLGLRQTLLGPVLACLLLTLTLAPALALNDAQQLVVEAWRLVNQSYVDPDQFEQVHWKRLRQKALEQPIERSEDAYRAIETMLAPLQDPYTRLLRPAAPRLAEGLWLCGDHCGSASINGALASGRRCAEAILAG